MDDYVRRRLEAFIYRPAHQAGKPVVRGGLTYRHDFRYNPALFSDTERTYIERNERQRTNPATSETAAATSDASGS